MLNIGFEGFFGLKPQNIWCKSVRRARHKLVWLTVIRLKFKKSAIICLKYLKKDKKRVKNY